MSIFTGRPAVRRPALVLAVAGGAVAVSGAGVYALLSATAFNETPQSAGSGTLSLTLADGTAGFNSPIENLKPTDAVSRYVALTNGGSLAGAGLELGVTDQSATDSLLSTDPVRGLQVAVQSCTVAWDEAAGTCGGTVTSELATSLQALTAAPAALGSGTMAAGQTKNLKVTVTLPDQDEETVNGVPQANSIQGLSASLTWTFTETQA